MAFQIGEEYLPAILTAHPMTDEEFAGLCGEHPDLFFEMTAEGDLIVWPPNYSITGLRHAQAITQLSEWAGRDGTGVVTDAASGFVLPNGARRSPDAAWTLLSRIRQVEADQIERYWHLCPDFVIEVRSKTDRLQVLQAKMREWIANGAQLGWLIDPETRTAKVYRPNGNPSVLENPDVPRGEGLLATFRLDLRLVWDPLQRRTT